MKPVCFFLLFLLPTSSHLIFKEIGTMAGSTSYIHVTVNVGLQEIEDKVMEYTAAILGSKALVNQTFESMSSSWKTKSPNTNFDDQRYEYMNMVQMFANNAGKLKSRIGSQRGVLPTPNRDVRAERERRGLKNRLFNAGMKVVGAAAGGLRTNLIQEAARGILRSLGSSNILFSLGQGILGTFMGLYTQSQIRKLRHEVSAIREDQERIVEAVTENKASITNLEKW